MQEVLPAPPLLQPDPPHLLLLAVGQLGELSLQVQVEMLAEIGGLDAKLISYWRFRLER